MKVSEILSLAIPTNQLIKIMDWSCSSRSINKARRNLGNARDIVCWCEEVELTTQQLEALDLWHGRTVKERDARKQEHLYLDALTMWSVTMYQEENLGSNSKTIARTKAARVKAMELRGSQVVPEKITKLDDKIIEQRKVATDESSV